MTSRRSEFFGRPPKPPGAEQFPRPAAPNCRHGRSAGTSRIAVIALAAGGLGKLKKRTRRSNPRGLNKRSGGLLLSLAVRSELDAGIRVLPAIGRRVLFGVSDVCRTEARRDHCLRRPNEGPPAARTLAIEPAQERSECRRFPSSGIGSSHDAYPDPIDFAKRTEKLARPLYHAPNGTY
jgi:hypothetical protein